MLNNAKMSLINSNDRLAIIKLYIPSIRGADFEDR